MIVWYKIKTITNICLQISSFNMAILWLSSVVADFSTKQFNVLNVVDNVVVIIHNMPISAIKFKRKKQICTVNSSVALCDFTPEMNWLAIQRCDSKFSSFIHSYKTILSFIFFLFNILHRLHIEQSVQFWSVNGFADIQIGSSTVVLDIIAEWFRYSSL